MMELSRDPREAEQQIYAIIYYLTTFGYIDGDFDLSEKEFIRDYVRRLARQQIEQSGQASGLAPEDYEALLRARQEHYLQMFEQIDRSIRELFEEAVAAGESLHKFVYNRLKLRCYEIFSRFDEANRRRLMETIDQFILADGVTHPAEVEFRNELAALLDQDIMLDLGDIEFVESEVSLQPETTARPSSPNHPLLKELEEHYSADDEKRLAQAQAEMQLVDRVRELLGAKRAEGRDRLRGHQSFQELMAGEEWLDGHVFCIPPKPGRAYDITVLGDLHGCYSNLKAALLQADFFGKVERFEQDPEGNPEPKLVLLGDYIDRGQFNYHGTLRAVLNLFLRYPNYVYPLRGNHEYYFEYEGVVYGGVLPAEAINGYRPYFPKEFFLKYMQLFEELPVVAVFDKFFFVHGGIPRQSTMQRWTDLSFLNDKEVRFEMLWSDPSEADVIPPALQEDVARFPFGRKQFAAFMGKVGCSVMVRGHTKVVEGFRKEVDDGTNMLLTVFSAGGEANEDLPEGSSYREVTPKALTITYRDGVATITPWVIDYEAYNTPAFNRFFSEPPQLVPAADAPPLPGQA